MDVFPSSIEFSDGSPVCWEPKKRRSKRQVSLRKHVHFLRKSVSFLVMLDGLLSDACHVENAQWPDDFVYYKFKLFGGLWRGSPCCTVLMRDICLESMYFCPSFPLLALGCRSTPNSFLGKSFCLYFWMEKF